MQELIKSTSTLFIKNGITIDWPAKQQLLIQEAQLKEKISEEKENVVSYNNSYSMIIMIQENEKRIDEEFERI